jgi:tight adherence protein B
MPSILIAIVFVVVFAVVILFLGFCLAFQKTKQNNQIRAMLRTADPVTAERAVDLLRPVNVQTSIEKLLRKIGLENPLNLYLDQAGVSWNGTKFVLVCAMAAVGGVVLSTQLPSFGHAKVTIPLFGVICGLFPLIVVSRKRAKRIRQFEEQFPEALDFLGRSMRAGHAFSIGLEMLVQDSAEPLASIFRRVLQDLHLGSPLDVSLGKLVTLVPLVDVRFFVSSVLLQQETGGNLSEILAKLSHVIRERFRLKGQVKAVSAHGRITGLVLVLMPVAVAVFMLLSSPSYLMTLFHDPDGQKMVMGAIGGQILGFICIKKITNIKV